MLSQTEFQDIIKKLIEMKAPILINTIPGNGVMSIVEEELKTIGAKYMIVHTDQLDHPVVVPFADYLVLLLDYSRTLPYQMEWINEVAFERVVEELGHIIIVRYVGEESYMAVDSIDPIILSRIYHLNYPQP